MEENRRRGIREHRREKAKKRKRNLIAVFCGLGIVVFSAVVIIIFVCQKDSDKNDEKKKREFEIGKEEKKELEEFWQSYLAGREDTVMAAAEGRTSFSDWFFTYYPQQTAENMIENGADGELTEQEFYQAAGESIHVAHDRYMGLLNNSETAKQNGIYERKGSVENQAEVTIAGDLCFAEDGFVLDYYDTVSDLSQCISPKLLEITNETDIFYLNHEYAISDKGAPLDGKYYTFRADPERMQLLKEMGTDIVSLANNHVYDYGSEAMLDTTEFLNQAEIPYVGGGKNMEEAKRPVYFIVNGMKIGFVGASNAEKIRYTPQAGDDSPGILLAYDTAEYNQVISSAATQCDYLIAYIHWGNEDTNQFNSVQQEMGREFLSSGADIVVGGHPHVLQGMEYVDGKPIVYSLGDYWFNDETKYTGLLKLHIGIEGLKEMAFVPGLQTGYTTRYLETAEEQVELFEFLEGLSPNIEIDKQGVIRER